MKKYILGTLLVCGLVTLAALYSGLVDMDQLLGLASVNWDRLVDAPLKLCSYSWSG